MKAPNLVFLTKNNESKVKDRLAPVLKEQIEREQLNDNERLAKLEEIRRNVIAANSNLGKSRDKGLH